jgi:hypothetical protein
LYDRRDSLCPFYFWAFCDGFSSHRTTAMLEMAAGAADFAMFACILGSRSFHLCVQVELGALLCGFFLVET